MAEEQTPQWHRDLEKAILKCGTQKAVAEKIGVSRTIVNWWLSGRRSPNSTSQLKLKELVRGTR